MPRNPYESYKKQSIMTMTPGDMLLTLYDEIVKQGETAKVAMERKEYGDVNRALQKAQRILNHLKATLDFKYDIAKNLNALYDYFIEQIVSANIKKNPAPLDEILPMIQELRDTYCEADKRSRSGAAGTTDLKAAKA